MVIHLGAFFPSLSISKNISLTELPAEILEYINISKNNKNKQSDKVQEFSPTPVNTIISVKLVELPFKIKS